MSDAPVVDLRSDTVTRPTAAMRAAIADAQVGDDALGDDPTVRLLERRVAQLLGKPAALFFPTGIMANQAAILLHAQRGTEIVCEAASHIVDWELGAAAAIAGAQVRTIATTDGLVDVTRVEAAIRPRSALQIQTSLIALENTHNAAGGRILPLDTMRAIQDIATARGLPVHLDGARLWNAAVATGVDLAEYAACADTVMVTLSKGLGCPAGSLLAGDDDVIADARVVRRRLGGSMRQSGILAAAGLYALEHHRDRLADDHRRARELAALAAPIGGLQIIEPDTNIVMFDVVRDGIRADDIVARLGAAGVLVTPFTPTRVRAVTHLDVDDEGIRRAAATLARVMAA
jgi:threonine aldolase